MPTGRMFTSCLRWRRGYLARGGRIGKAQAFLGTTLPSQALLAVVEGGCAGESSSRKAQGSYKT